VVGNARGKPSKSKNGSTRRNQLLAGPLSVVRMAPYDAKRVEDNGISDCQLVGINDNLTGIVDNGIQCQTPVLMTDDALTVLTS
jgi:hypothetical protein